MWRTALCIVLVFTVFSGNALAGRPLITDDVSTQGKGRLMLQTGFDYARDNSDGVRVNKGLLSMELDYGITDNIDLTLSTGYQFLQINNQGDTSSPTGMADTLLELKWRFYENGKGLGLALKPGFFIPTGNYTKGAGSPDYRLGTGTVRPRLYLVGTQEAGPFTFHLNLGYMRNVNHIDAQTDLWHLSLAAEWKIMKKLRVVCNIGVDTNLEKGTTDNPAFILGGVVYSLTDKIDIDCGVKRGLNEPGYDMTYTGGVSIKF